MKKLLLCTLCGLFSTAAFACGDCEEEKKEQPTQEVTLTTQEEKEETTEPTTEVLLSCEKCK